MTKGRPFAAFDIDGTLIRWQLYHALADRLARLGHIDPDIFQRITDARMDWKRRRRAEAFKEYEIELVRLFETILKEINVGHFEEAADAVFEEYKDQVYIYTRELLKKLKAEGYLLFAISASQAVLIRKIAEYYGFDDYAAAEYEEINGRFTGEVQTTYGRKDEVLKRLVKKHRAGFDRSIAVGDSTSDVAMFELVRRPIVFNPEHKLLEQAKKRGWNIVLERKNVTYELEERDGEYQLVKTN
jgi:HAD superfamily hydrolase (TIGR01490 family)